jgi:hypothetical protein
MLPRFQWGEILCIIAGFLLIFGCFSFFTHHNMLTYPDESVATKNQINIILCEMMEMLLLSFNQVRRYRQQSTPLKLQQYNPSKRISNSRL